MVYRAGSGDHHLYSRHIFIYVMGEMMADNDPRYRTTEHDLIDNTSDPEHWYPMSNDEIAYRLNEYETALTQIADANYTGGFPFIQARNLARKTLEDNK